LKEMVLMKPSRLLLEISLFFIVFFLPGYLAQTHPPAAGRASTLAMLQVIITGAPQFLLMLYVAGLGKGKDSHNWGLVTLEPRDGMRILVLVLGCFAVVAPFVALALALPPRFSRSLTLGYRWGLLSAAQAPLALLFGLTAGYREEFFFRSYLLGRFGQLGLPVPVAAVSSIALFSLGHIYEGPLGVAIAVALGALFTVVYLRRPNLHVIAISHGLYNAIVLWLSLLIPQSLPAAAGILIFRP
jgi:membrane protease YdiL (CAAX protease family)